MCKSTFFCKVLRVFRCYTNHALDQFLEHILESVTNRIVRMGSRSNSEKLAGYNLIEWRKSQAATSKTSIQRRTEGQILDDLKFHAADGTTLCQTLSEENHTVQWEQISSLLLREYPSHYSQLVGGVDEDGFERVGRKGGTFFYYWISCSDLKDRAKVDELYGTSSSKRTQDKPRHMNELLSPIANIWDFSKSERKLIVGYWKNVLAQDWTEKLVQHSQNFDEERTKLEKLRSEYNRQLLENADVIGLTTTGLARYAPLLDRVGAKTLICEEAGEVLEVGSLL